MQKLIILGFGGFFGAITRYYLSGLVQSKVGTRFPWGTLTVNVIGCFIIGFLMFIIEERQFFSHHARLLLTTGFLGALTTFSTFGHETIKLISDKSILFAAGNIFVNVILSLLAVIFGRFIAKLIFI